ncbi:MAG: DUF1501 domain-containing protein [Planctomycetota bacterium]|nr:MAG: DUF1501 domain-containing protein [Planctomycetota bacterium]
MSIVYHTGGRPSRRKILQGGIGWATIPFIPKIVYGGNKNYQSRRILVLLHLSGGNDGLNTVIPYTDPLYYEFRPQLSRAAKHALAINSQIGIHSSLASLVPLFRRGHLAIIQGVGYENPDYSHAGSCRIWTSGQTDPTIQDSWWDRILKDITRQGSIMASCVGSRCPATMATTRLANIRVTAFDTDVTSPVENPVEYKPGHIRQTFTMLARLVRSPKPPQLIFGSIGGFDTHTDQLERHTLVLGELGEAIASFQYELEIRGMAERVILMVWSEFGRRPAENAMGGTDHGSAGPIFLLGQKIRGGLYGKMPSLAHTDFGNLIPAVDFRTIYKDLAEQWLNWC